MVLGNDVRLLQPYQVALKLVPLLKSTSAEKVVKLVQSLQVELKLVPLLRFNLGKLIIVVQSSQALLKLVTQKVLTFTSHP